MRPDPSIVTQQLLLAYASVGRWRFFLWMRLGQGGYALLRASGLPSGRARAINLMARRVARRWQAEGVSGTAGLVLDEARRLTA